jgi:hypothetical protein
MLVSCDDTRLCPVAPGTSAGGTVNDVGRDGRENEVRGDFAGDEGADEASYTGGGTNDAFFGLNEPGALPASRAACRSEAYRSWKDLLWLISIATARRSAEIPFIEEDASGCIGSSPQITRARSCWCSGARAWIEGTVLAHTRRKEMNAGGQLSYESSIGVEDFEALGRGTEGGFVVDRNAAKYRHSAGPVIIKSPSGLANTSTSINFSTFACANDDFR